MTALADRIRICAGLVGSGDELARKSGIARRTLENYLTGREPQASRLLAIARAAGVSLDWLVSGDGDIQPSAHVDTPTGQSAQLSANSSGSSVFPVDAHLTARVTDGIMRVHKDMGLTLAPARLGELIFQMLADIGAAADGPEEYDAQLEIMLARLKRKLQAAIAEPGTGKRSA